jgi:NAD(P)-dependent dehydrogenase (short-subunit alcohol dehydrogenase family)
MSYLEELFTLKDRIAVVTGGTRGIGKGIAQGLLGAGARCLIVGVDEQRLQDTVAEFRANDYRAEGLACDLSDRAGVQRLIDYVRNNYERLDVLVNNAGITVVCKLTEYPEETWDKTLFLNLKAPFLLAKELAPLMCSSGCGSIINVTSLNAEQGFPDNPAYLASKGGLRQLTKSLARDLGEHGIRANSIGPGYFHTDMNSASWSDPERRAARAERSILGRWGEPKDVAGMAVFLASDASSFVTGQDFYIDGGWLAKGL